MHQLMTIQSKLKAPKNQFNNFGKYKYRNCEDILEAVKPLLLETETVLVMSDDAIQVGERYYIKATAQLFSLEKGLIAQASAFAREDAARKGMDLSQLTGATSSYARKYALNALFAIDDNKDSDSTNKGDADSGKKQLTEPSTKETKKQPLEPPPEDDPFADLSSPSRNKTAGKSTNFRWLKGIKLIKDRIVEMDGNADSYYRFLGIYKANKANDILDAKIENEVKKDLMAYLKSHLPEEDYGHFVGELAEKMK